MKKLSILSILVVSLLAGCGAGQQSSGRPQPTVLRQPDTQPASPQVRAQVLAVARQYLRSERENDGKTFCSLLAPEALAQQMQQIRSYGPAGAGLDCAALHDGRALPGQSQSQAARMRALRAKIDASKRLGKVTTGGQTATVAFSYRSPIDQRAQFKRLYGKRLKNVRIDWDKFPRKGELTRGALHLKRVGSQWRVFFPSPFAAAPTK